MLWRRKLSPTTLTTSSGYLGEYPWSLLTWIWKFTILHILVLFPWYTSLCVCIWVIKPTVYEQRKPSWWGPMLMWTCFLHSWVYPLAQLTSIWKVVFWTFTNCDSHKLQQNRNPCHRNLWFVAICYQSRYGANWVQQYWTRVLGTWESTHVTFNMIWKLQVSPLSCYFIGISVCMFISYNVHKWCIKETSF